MLISKRTLDILKNYFTINQSILVTEGNKLKTMAIARNILASAEVEESFPVEFAIYNLNEFLSSISLFDKPDVEFTEKYALIREEGSTRGGLKYYYANKALITYPTKDITMPNDIAVEFVLTEEVFNKISRASAVLGVTDVAVIGDKDGISLVVKDRKNDSSNDFEIMVSDDSIADPFEFYFKQDNLKLIPGDYNVSISPKGISLFKRADGTMEYAVALEAK